MVYMCFFNLLTPQPFIIHLKLEMLMQFQVNKKIKRYPSRIFIFFFKINENLKIQEFALLSPKGSMYVTVYATLFRFRTISLLLLAGLLSYCIHTSLRGCRCAF